MLIRRRSNPGAWCAVLAFVLATFAGAALADPPGRVARVSYLRGNVSFQPAGDDQWAQMSLNRPLGTGDKVYTDRDSRIEMEIGAADIRLDQGTTFDLLNLDDNAAQIQLTDGIMNLHVRRLGSGQTYEVDTPTLAFVISQPGDYRVDIDPQGRSTMVTVFRGSGDVYGENNASYSVRSGNAYRFNDSALRDYEVLDLPRPDDFDQWVSSRNQRYERAVSRQYVSEDVIGYADLDDYGSWSSVADYGNVWYPTTVEVGWAPYRYGRWSWVDPWGWSWVDSSPWGFAPFHYGRWAYIGNRWGWCPGRRDVVSVYSPAMVAFVGGNNWGISIGGGGPVGWFPLGPRDVYVPWYRASRNYFTNINVRNTTVINNTYITNVYNNYSNGRPITNVNYAYRQNTNAFTAVPRDAFVNARAVNASRVQITPNNLRGAEVVSRVGITPTRASFVPAEATRGRAAPPNAAAFNRGVIARTAPPPQPAPIADRLQAIQRNGSQPLGTNQLREIATRQSPAAGAQPGQPGRAAIPSRVQVVGQNARAPQPLPMRGGPDNAARGGSPDNATRGGPANERGMPGAGARPGVVAPNAPNTPNVPNAPNTRAPITAPGSNNGNNNVPNRAALPSSRFAPHPGDATRNMPGNAAMPGGRATPNTPNAPNPALRGGPQNQAPVQGRGNLPTEQRNNPAIDRSAPNVPSRGAPSTQYAPRAMPQQQQPQQRSAPQYQVPRQESRSTPQYQTPRQEQRSTPQYQMPRQEQRSAPQYQAPRQEQRSAPQYQAPRQEQRSAPQYQMPRQEQRSAPQYQAPRQEQRSAPQYQAPRPEPRAMPQQQPQQRSAPQPQQQERRAAPQQRGGQDRDKDHGR